MRSRYAAYARGAVDHIVATTDPMGPMWQADAASWRAGVAQFHRDFRFPGVRILAAPEPEGDEGSVTFHARLQAGGHDVGFTERSRFVRRDGRWLYHSGERLADGG
jgi:SEC-C motif-containing protein